MKLNLNFLTGTNFSYGTVPIYNSEKYIGECEISKNVENDIIGTLTLNEDISEDMYLYPVDETNEYGKKILCSFMLREKPFDGNFIGFQLIELDIEY